MNKRLLSISIIAWFLIFSAAVSLQSVAHSHNSPQAQAFLAKNTIPQNIQIAIVFVFAAIKLVCGISMLKGANWSRFTYVSAAVIEYAYLFLTFPSKLVVIQWSLIFAIIVLFLFRPAANAFFASKSTAIPPPLP